MSDDDVQGSPADVIHAIMESHQLQRWAWAPTHWLGKGPELGIDTYNLRKKLDKMKKQGRHHEASTLQAIARAA
eukprot:3031948-Pyramimonas_sp.AAC.1